MKLYNKELGDSGYIAVIVKLSGGAEIAFGTKADLQETAGVQGTPGTLRFGGNEVLFAGEPADSPIALCAELSRLIAQFDNAALRINIRNRYRALRECNTAARQEILSNLAPLSQNEEDGDLWLGSQLAKKMAASAVADGNLQFMEQFEYFDPFKFYRVKNDKRKRSIRYDSLDSNGMAEVIALYENDRDGDSLERNLKNPRFGLYEHEIKGIYAAIEQGRLKSEYISEGWHDPFLNFFAGTKNDSLWLGIQIREYIRLKGKKTFYPLELQNIRSENIYHVTQNAKGEYESAEIVLSSDTVREIKYIQQEKNYEPDDSRLDYCLLMDKVYGNDIIAIKEASKTGVLDYHDFERALANNYETRTLICRGYETLKNQCVGDIRKDAKALQSFDVPATKKCAKTKALKYTLSDERGEQIFALERERKENDIVYRDVWYFTNSYNEKSAIEFMKSWDINRQ